MYQITTQYLSPERCCPHFLSTWEQYQCLKSHQNSRLPFERDLMAGVGLRLSHFQINPQPSSYLHHQAYSIFLPFQLIMLNLITCFSARQQIHIVILFRVLSLLTPSFDIWIYCLCVEECKLSVPLLSRKDKRYVSTL